MQGKATPPFIIPQSEFINPEGKKCVEEITADPRIENGKCKFLTDVMNRPQHTSLQFSTVQCI